MTLTLVEPMAVIKRQHSVSIATIHNGTQRQLTVYGATSLKNMRIQSQKFEQCNKYDVFAPCTCVEAHTSIVIDAQMKDRFTTTHNKRYDTVEISLTEYDCKSVHPIVETEGLACAQLSDIKTMYRDAHNNPIEIEVHYNNGCELRCLTSDGCKQFFTNTEMMKGSSTGR